MFTSFKRALSFALTDFYRNKGMSIAAVFVLTITTLLITGGFFMSGITTFLITTIENKIDITAYFKQDTPEQDILNIKEELLKDSDSVKNVEYVSREDALNNFIERHKDDPDIAKALIEVGDNPFFPSLNITTTGSTYQYEEISNILQQEQFENIVEKVDFSQKKDTIEKVFSITKSINRFMWGLIIILVLISALVVFNTIKLIIDRSKEEINTMKIVGAGSWFIKAPFVIQGIIFGLASFAICFLITTFFVYLLSGSISALVPGFRLSDYFASNIWIIILIQLGFSVGLGVVSSLVVIRRHLKF